MKMKEVHFHNITDIDKALPVQKLSHSVYDKSSFVFLIYLKDSIWMYMKARKRVKLLQFVWENGRWC